MLEATESTGAPGASRAIATWPPSGVSTQKSPAEPLPGARPPSPRDLDGLGSPNASSSAAPRTAAS